MLSMKDQQKFAFQNNDRDISHQFCLEFIKPNYSDNCDQERTAIDAFNIP